MIKSFNFTIWPSDTGIVSIDKAKESIDLLLQSTSINSVVICIMALQDTPFTDSIDYVGDHVPTDNYLKELINYCKSLDLKVILKPMVNCRDGAWRAHINFFDKEVPGEAKWSNWFSDYFAYLLHYAVLAEETDCEMLIIGCEMVQAERKAEYWRKLIDEIREVYTGLISYNTDKYQEEVLTWWDAVDVISSSGYYPIDRWDDNLDRIENVVKTHNKPFFFAECGCPSRKGSSLIPNDWEHIGDIDLEEQESYYKTIFEECAKRDWIGGFAFWNWHSDISNYEPINDDYSVYQKPAEKIVKYYFEEVL